MLTILAVVGLVANVVVLDPIGRRRQEEGSQVGSRRNRVQDRAAQDISGHYYLGADPARGTARRAGGHGDQRGGPHRAQFPGHQRGYEPARVGRRGPSGHRQPTQPGVRSQRHHRCLHGPGAPTRQPDR